MARPMSLGRIAGLYLWECISALDEIQEPGKKMTQCQ
jgi:hypothetical protein